MTDRTLLVVLLIQLAVVVVVGVVWYGLARWQLTILRREKGKSPQGFEVQFRDKEAK